MALLTGRLILVDMGLFLGSLIGFFLGIYMFAKGLIWFQRSRLIENIPTSKIRSIAMGRVEVYGEVESGRETLKSPATQRDCVYYRFILEEKHGPDSRNPALKNAWITKKDEEFMRSFHLKDDTGRVLIDPAGAIVDLEKHLDRESEYSGSVFSQGKARRSYEYLIEPGDRIYVIGTAQEKHVLGQAGEKEETDRMEIGKKDKWFYISDRPERTILRSLKRDAITWICSGAALTLLSFMMILFYLDLL